MLKKALADKMLQGDSVHVKFISYSLNLFRWMHHFHLQEYGVVNIPSATLRYYKMDSLLFQMKTVVGSALHQNTAVSYLYRQDHLLSLLECPQENCHQRIPSHFQEESGHGRLPEYANYQRARPIMDYRKLNWALFTKQNFPYDLRQSTGCDNALGVIKFNLTSPYDVYMHDTNFKKAFSYERRFYSHGCIRLEKPLLLANQILGGKVDSNYLQSCLRDQEPVPINIDKRIPVFVVYMPALADGSENIIYYRDVYGLLKK